MAEIFGSKDMYDDYSYEIFQSLAADVNQSVYERIGFPDGHREGYEEIIYQDILSKLPSISRPGNLFLEIGPGASNLPKLVSNQVLEVGGHVTWIDGEAVLSHLPDGQAIRKIYGKFPLENQDLGLFDSILIYSVLHYINTESSLEIFLDSCLSLLNSGGRILIGDIPNVSMRKRFFSSQQGIEFHRKYMNTEKAPEVLFGNIELGKMDDSSFIHIIMRSRIQGFHAYLLPQDSRLPFANRREDILIVKP